MSDVLCEVRNGVGYITLNRPKALNSLNLVMVQGMHQALKDWERDDSVKAVIVSGEGEKAFCAGGDIRSVYENEMFGKDDNMIFFAEEYALNQYIFEYPKPYIAIMDGFVMGGGMGISQGASYRIVTERSKISMPESGIGFFPDVGGSYFLPRCPGSLGLYLGITGVIINSEDAIYADLADVYLPSEKLPLFRESISDIHWSNDPRADINNLLSKLSARRHAVDSSLEKLSQSINHHFSLTTIPEIVGSLLNEKSADYKVWAQKTVDVMNKRSPISMVGTQLLLRYGKQLSLAQCFAMELGLVKVWLKQGDFVEGVRALIIDKDNQPKWRYTLTELTPSFMHPFFEHVKGASI